MTRKDYLKEVLVRTQWQHTFIFNDDYEKFIEVIEERATLIQKVEEINQAHFVEWSQEEKEIIQQINALDKENTAEYVRQLQEAKEEVKRINQLMMGHNKYRDPYGQFFDSGIYFDGGRR